ncbi:MAG: AIPR family protein [Oscillatoria sp. PMC 1068.18]|nr:AIPR family protein [Oscillatoria sp. PMC 1068.18]
MKDSGLEHLDEATAFEYFVNYTILSKLHPDRFDLEETITSGSNDNALDGVAVIVNDHIVTSQEEVDYFRLNLSRLDVKFIFIQSKTSAKFDSGDLGNFLFGVKSFFKEQPTIPTNAKIDNLRALKNYIYDDHSFDMDEAPICEMYYVTTGTWTGDANLEGRVKVEKTALEETKILSSVKFFPIDNENLKRFYSELQRKITKEINFEKHIAMPSISEVHQAFIGVLPASEYLKLITDADGNLLRSLFYDNVRDFQGNNPVNQEIQATIQAPEQSDRFALLNNGITIVAKNIQQMGSRFSIQDYQVVNGCQTSHIIFINKHALTEKMFVPLKLIVINDTEVTNQIIRATNRQTQVYVEAFESTETFHKQLEEFYNTFNDEPRLYYERRSKQYDGLAIKPTSIISLATQAKCFLGMFLNEPHSTHRYYGELLKSYRDKIFKEEHNPYPYYCSGYSYALLEHFFEQQALNAKDYRQFRFHLLMLFRLFTEGEKLPYLNSKKIEKYCNNIHKSLLDEVKALEIFKRGTHLIDRALKKVTYSGFDATRRKIFTNELINFLIDELNKSPEKTKVVKQLKSRVIAAQVQYQQGTVKKFSDVRRFGFIQGNYPQDIFVHINDICGKEQRLTPGDTVKFVLVKNEKGLNAKEVTVVKHATDM